MIGVIHVLAKRELVRFFRQPHRVVGSLAQPLIFWVLLGSGFGASFRAPTMTDVSYMEYFYPGILMMLMLFSSIFSTITLIEDRNQGLLQEVLVAPVPRIAIVLGKVSGAMSVAMLQCLVLLAAAPFLGFQPGFLGGLLLLLGLILSSLGFTALGFLIAWRMESTAGYHAVMSIFLMPMWLLSGAIFPLENLPTWLWSVMIINPATHALKLVRMPLYEEPMTLLSDSTFLVSLGVALFWAIACLWLAMKRVERADCGAPLTQGVE
ncbi:MAG: ABC transporter permease [Magnetococcales bacterium]|nr:ABC transporter permease [Magnetococcales bacterium]